MDTKHLTPSLALKKSISSYRLYRKTLLKKGIPSFLFLFKNHICPLCETYPCHCKRPKDFRSSNRTCPLKRKKTCSTHWFPIYRTLRGNKEHSFSELLIAIESILKDLLSCSKKKKPSTKRKRKDS